VWSGEILCTYVILSELSIDLSTLYSSVVLIAGVILLVFMLKLHHGLYYV